MRHIPLFLLTLAVASLVSAPGHASNPAPIYLGLYDRAHFGTVTQNDMPFDDSPDAPGPGRPLSRADGGILPIGKLEGTRFTSIGSHDEDMSNAYAIPLRACYTKAEPSTRVSCALRVASGPTGFAEPALATTTWYCNGLPLRHKGASASFNDSDGVDYPVADLEYAVEQAACPRPAGTTATTPLVVTSDKSVRSIPFDGIYATHDAASVKKLAALVWPIVRGEWQRRVGAQLAARPASHACEDIGVNALAAITRLKATLAAGATWADYIATGGSQYWYEANLGDGKTLLFVELSAPVEGVPKTGCPWRAHAQLWLTGDGTSYTITTPPRTDVVLPMTLVVIEARRYIVSTIAPSDVIANRSEGDPKPELSLDIWDENRLLRLGYPGLKPSDSKDDRFPYDARRP